MKATLWNKEKGTAFNFAVANDPSTIGFYRESDDMWAAKYFYLDLMSLIDISQKYDVDCFVRDFTERRYYLVMTENDEKKSCFYHQIFYFPITGVTNSDRFINYLRNHREFFRDAFKYYHEDKSNNNESIDKLVRRLNLEYKFLELFKADNIITPEEIEANREAIEEESKYHFAITFINGLAG